jgi:hypothetical protein
VRNRVKAELAGSPLQVLFGGGSFLVSAASLWVAVRTGGPSFATPPNAAMGITPTASNYLVCVSAMLAIAATAASLSRIIRLASWFAGYFASILIAVAAHFLITLVFRTQGVRFGAAADQPGATLWAILCCVGAVFAAVNGQRYFEDIVRFMAASRGEEATNGELATIALLVAGIWLGAVRYGTITFATELL